MLRRPKHSTIEVLAPKEEEEEEEDTRTHLTKQRLYIIFRCYRITLRAKHFYTNRKCCEMLTECLSPGSRPGGDWANS
jgi:hypothetical protein